MGSSTARFSTSPPSPHHSTVQPLWHPRVCQAAAAVTIILNAHKIMPFGREEPFTILYVTCVVVSRSPVDGAALSHLRSQKRLHTSLSYTCHVPSTAVHTFPSIRLATHVFSQNITAGGALGITLSPLSSDNSSWAPSVHPPNSFASLTPLGGPAFSHGQACISHSWKALLTWMRCEGWRRTTILNQHQPPGDVWNGRRHCGLSPRGEVLLGNRPAVHKTVPQQRITQWKMSAAAQPRDDGAKAQRLPVKIRTLGFFLSSVSPPSDLSKKVRQMLRT